MNKAYKITLVADSKAIVYLKTKDRRIAWRIDKIGNIECSYHDNRYAFVIEEIIGQMLSNKVAAIITERLIGLYNGDVTPNHVKALSYEQLRLIALSNSKTNYIQIFTDAVLNGDINLAELDSCDDQEVIQRLTAIRGIGPWTAKMYLLFALQRLDILPTEDVAFLQAYKWLYDLDEISKQDLSQKYSIWRPYSSIAARYLYRALDSGLTKIERYEE